MIVYWESSQWELGVLNFVLEVTTKVLSDSNNYLFCFNYKCYRLWLWNHVTNVHFLNKKFSDIYHLHVEVLSESSKIPRRSNVSKIQNLVLLQIFTDFASYSSTNFTQVIINIHLHTYTSILGLYLYEPPLKVKVYNRKRRMDMDEGWIDISNLKPIIPPPLQIQVWAYNNFTT